MTVYQILLRDGEKTAMARKKPNKQCVPERTSRDRQRERSVCSITHSKEDVKKIAEL